MSKLFKYSKVKDVVNFDGMLPGQVSRNAYGEDVRFSGLVSNLDMEGDYIEYVENGELVKLNRGTDYSEGKLTYTGVFVYKTTEAFAEPEKYGIVLADIKGQTERTPGPNFIYKHLPNTTVTVMTKGYVYVPIQDNGEIGAGHRVYTDKKGGIVTASYAGEKVELTKAKFTGLYGYPLSSKQNGTQGSNLTGRTAEIVLDVDLF